MKIKNGEWIMENFRRGIFLLLLSLSILHSQLSVAAEGLLIRDVCSTDYPSPVADRSYCIETSSQTFLRYNGSAWVAFGTAGSMSIGGSVTSATAGSILFVSSGPVLNEDASNFTYTLANKAITLTNGSGKSATLSGVDAGGGVPSLILTDGSGSLNIHQNSTTRAVIASNNVPLMLSAKSGSASNPTTLIVTTTDGLININNATGHNFGMKVLDTNVGSVTDAGGSNLAFLRQGGRTRVSTQFDKTNTTLNDVTGLTTTLRNGWSYGFEAILFVDADATGGGKYAIVSGGTVTSIKYYIEAVEDSSGNVVISSRQTSSGGSAGQAGATALRVRIVGTIECGGSFGSGQSFSVQFAQNAANGTSSVLTNSSLIVWPM